MTRFRKISSIDIDNESSWWDAIFLTFDIDWAHDDVLNDTIDLVEDAGVAATWFVTHDTPVLDKLRANSKFELGIHPNFNFLLEGDDRNGSNAREGLLHQVISSNPFASNFHDFNGKQGA